MYNTWKLIGENPPEEGFEFLLFNKKWINEDYNPKGVRIGYLDGTGVWVTAYWCNIHDEYHTRYSDEDNTNFVDYKAENQIPTHWLDIIPNTPDNPFCDCIKDKNDGPDVNGDCISCGKKYNVKL